MKRLFVALLFTAALSPLSLRGQQLTGAEQLEWLRSLALEGRLALTLSDAAAPRLFTETFPDGRTWFDYISDTLASEGDWALLDQAVSVCLSEAQSMKSLAVQNAGTGTEARFTSARKRHLQGAAHLMGVYKTAANDTFDQNAGGLLALPSLPDWALPGEIRIHEMAGGGSLNVETLGFSGRLSGRLELPSLESMLVVPNFSFDSRGNIDLTAYGQTAFPPNDPDALTLTIPPRRPLAFHLADDGNFSIAGGLRLGFPDGNVVEGFFDIDDPDYAFGLSFTGKITIELAKELNALRPEITSDEVLTLAEIDGLAEFFGSFGQGLETFVDEDANLSASGDLNIGVAPEFEKPETILPSDVMAAWVLGYSNPEVRNRLNLTAPKAAAPPDRGLSAMNEMLAGLNGELLAARKGVAPKLHQVQRLRRLVILVDRTRKLTERAQNEFSFGNEDESSRLFVLAEETAKAAADAASEFLTLTPPSADPRTGIAAIHLWVDVSGLASALSSDNYAADFALARNRLDPWLNTYLAVNGFDPQGLIADPSLVAKLSLRDLYTVIVVALEFDRLAVVLGTELSPSTVPIDALFRALYNRVKSRYDAAVAANDEATRALYAIWMAELGSAEAIYEFAADPADSTALLSAVVETHAAISTGGQEGLASRIILAARRDFDLERKLAIRKADDLLGYPNDHAATLNREDNFDPTAPLFRRWYFALKKAVNDGVVSAAFQSDSESALQAVMTAFADSQSERFAATANVEQNLEEAFDVLLILTDLVAIAEDMTNATSDLTVDIQETWQALHTKSTGAATDQRAHSHLAEYSREIPAAATRYGANQKNLEGPLLTAFQNAGSEAVAGLDTIIDALAEGIDSQDPDDFKFALPGNMEIQRLYGEVAFNRQTLAWALAFGGRLSFPEINALFEVPRATLDSTGAFSLEMLASSDSAFGLSDEFSLSFAIPADSGVPFTGTIPLPSNNFTAGLDGFSGMGTLTYHQGLPDQQIFTASVAYLALYEASNLVGHQFAVETMFNGNWEVFTEEIMLFTGGFGFNLETMLNGTPTQGGAKVQAGVGLLLRPDANPDPFLRTLDDYYLGFDGEAALEFNTAAQTVDITLVSGTLTLPKDIFSGPDATDPTISLLTPICARLDFNDPDGLISWCDLEGNPVRIAFDNIGFKIPGLPDSEASGVTSDPTAVPNPENDIPGFQAGLSAVLLLTGNDFPVIEKINATVQFPMPGIGSSSAPEPNLINLNITGQNWRLDGFPDQAALSLGSSLTILNLSGLTIDLLGSNDPDPANHTKLEFLGNPDLGPPTLRFTAGIEGRVDGEMLWDGDQGEGASFATNASIEWVVGANLPMINLGDVTITGNFNLGGPNGITVKGASTLGQTEAALTFVNPLNLFQRSPAQPFEIRLSGALDVANFIEFGLEETSIIWDDQDALSNLDGTITLVPRLPSANLIPRFSVGGFYGALGDEAIDLAGDLLPFYPTLVGLRFRNGNLSLLPPPGQMSLFDPSNVLAILSGVVNLPNGAAVAAGSPGLFGAVDQLEIGFIFDNDLGFYVPDFENLMLDGFCLKLSNLDIPPLGGISGGICIKNLSALPDRPQDLYFAGTVGGKVKDIGASILLAAKPTEFIGACFELSGGPAGIPLDGGMLGGILLTGGRGGINFKNQFSDPCDFRSYVDTDSSVPAPGSPERPGNPEEPPAQIIPPDWAGGPFTCVSAPFPPPSVNPLCEEFPVGSGRFVFKGTRLDETTLNALGITPATVNDRPIDVVITLFVDQVVDLVEAELQDAVLDATDAGTPLEAVEFFLQLADGLLQSFDDAATSVLLQAVRTGLEVPAGQPVPSVYDLIVAKAAEGIPCFDVTLKVGGTISHSAISTVLSGSGDVTLSTTGTATLEGSINLIGIPVATGTLALSLTNDQGMIDPAFGGLAKVALGPLELGELSAAISCQGCFLAVATEFGNLLACQGAAPGPEAAEFIYQMMEATFPDRIIDRGMSLTDHFNTFNTQEQLAIISSFFNFLQLVVNGDPLPVTVSPTALANFRDCFIDFIIALFPQVNPFICFSGEVGAKLFGFPLTGGADSVFAASLVYGRVEDNGQQFQELTASAGFSPTYMILAPTLGRVVPVVPAFDSASMGYSLRVPAFTRETVELLLTDPAQFASDQFSTLVNDAVLAFGYELSPLGIKLASGQGRMIMPRLETHPENPNRVLPSINGVDPVNRWGGLLYGSQLDAFIEQERAAERPVKLPTRSELILAALSKGQLKNPRWRGTHADLATLFTDPAIPLDPNADSDDPLTPGYTSSNATCDQLTGEVAVALEAADPGLTELALRSMPNDYFPHGGLIGGAELAFPNALANELPGSQLTRLFSLPLTVDEFTDEWLPNAQRLFANPNDPDPEPGDPGYAYFTGTNCVGQMALYLPAPNPVLPDPNNPGQFNVIDFQTASLGDMISSLQEADFSSILQGADAFFPDEEILLSGWLDAPILGMPVARGSMNYDNNTKVFDLHAAIPPGTWLADWVGASIDFEIKPPEYQLANLSPESAAEKLQVIGDSLTTAAFGNTQAIIDEIATTMPKVSTTAAMNLTIPPTVEPYLNTAAAANLEMFAFSPAFEPDYLPAVNSPYAVARRRGGIGIRGDFQLGYFPDGGEPIEINIEDASFAVLPSSNPLLPPALAGTLLVSNLDFNPNLPAFTDGELSFATEPDNLAPYLALEGHLEPFGFVLPGTNLDLLKFAPLNRGGTIGGRLEILRDDSIPGVQTGTSLSIDPLSATIPFLGPEVAIAVYGEEPQPGSFTPFTFATTAGQDWSATMCLSSPLKPSFPPTFAICDPFNPGGPCLLEFTPNDPVCGTLSGTGLSHFQLELAIPAGFTATFFPGTDAEVSQFFGGAGNYSLYIDSNGRFFIDFGNQNGIGLPGALTAGGRFEFGFNPDGSHPNVIPVPRGLTLGSADLSETSTASISIQNQGTAEANLVLAGSSDGEFFASSNGFSLAPGTSRVVDIVFSPKAPGLRTGTLRIESNDPDSPVINVPLRGTGTASPRFFKSRDTIDFGPTLQNATSKGTLTIGNDGSSPMQITGITIPNPRFAISPNGPTTIQPGDSQTYLVSFTPTTLNQTSGNVTFGTATLGSHNVFVSGIGSESRWVKVLDSEITGNNATLNDILMLDDARRGYVVGDRGTVLETDNGGRSWIPRVLTSFDMKALAMRRTINNPVVAEYHFEEPPGSRIFRDESGNAHHGRTPSAGESPQIGYAYGRIGSGLNFDDINDSVDLATFNLSEDWSIAMWINPTSTANRQSFLGKNSSNGGNQFIFGFFENGYHLHFNSETFTGGTKQTGWQHLVLTADYNATTDLTTIRLYRDGIQLWVKSYRGKATPLNNGKPWSIGQEWDSSTARSDFFGGQIDELYFFDDVLNSTEITSLRSASDAASQRMVMAGSDGMVFESLTNGRAWTQLADQNILGWRSRFGLYHDYDFSAVEIAANGKIILGGSKDGNRLVMIEDRDPGGNPSPQIPEDDKFDEADFNGAAGSGANEPLFALRERGHLYTGSTFGRFYRASTTANDFFRHGTFDHTGAIRDLVTYQGNSFVAVGDHGGIMRTFNNANPELQGAGLTTAHLRSIDYNPSGLNRFFAVGDNGTFLTGSADGTTWSLVPDGLTGNMRGVSAAGGALPEVWAVGEEQLIQYRPSSPNSGPFLTFFPGELDFGFLLTNQSKTLPLKLTNSGKRDLLLDQIVVTGAPFTIQQSSLGAIQPGDSVTLMVRYKPTSASSLDAGELVLNTNEGGAPVRVRLRGRASGRNWQPVFLGVEGKVLDVVFTSATIGYALVDLGTGQNSRLYKTVNGGQNWTNLNLGDFGANRLRLTGLDFHRSSTTLGFVSGRLETGSGDFVRGIILRSLASGSNWTDRTPGGVADDRPFADIKFSSAESFVVVTSNSDPDGNGDVWLSESTGSSWDNTTLPPSDHFDGRVVGHVPNFQAGNNFSLVLASSGSRLYSKSWQNNWRAPGVEDPAAAFQASQIIRDFSFFDDPAVNFLIDHGWIVGDHGLFWRWDSGGPAGAEWYPPANAEVFGTTNLAKVSFHGESTGWVVGESKIFDSNDGGRSWDLHYDAGPDADLGAVFSFNDTAAWAGGSLGDQALVWRYWAKSAPAAPLVRANDVEFFDPLLPGQNATKPIQIANGGTALSILDIHQIAIESDDPIQRWSIDRAPTAIVAGVPIDLDVRFDASPEPIDIAALDPEVFLRFEDEWPATTFLDCTVHQRDGTAPANLDQRPRITQAKGKRDRCLKFDGIDDYAQADVIDSLGSAYSFSIWVNIEGTRNGQSFFGKHTSTGNTNRILCGYFAGGYYFAVNHQPFDDNSPIKLGWQHIAVTCQENGPNTDVVFYRDGEILWSHTYTTRATNVSGLPWILGADWDPGPVLSDHLTGCLDDFAVFNRLLTEHEIRTLANKSPVTGIHEAKLVINSNAENGVHTIDLRAEVLPSSRMVTFQTNPPGLQLTVDGVNYTAPVSFGVGSVGGQREWCEGSIHTVTAIDADVITADGGTELSYEFNGWDVSADRTLTVVASTAAPSYPARYLVTSVTDPNPPPAPGQAPPAGGPPAFNLSQALVGTPQGPFIRLSNGSLTVPALGNHGFAMEGELFLSLTKMSASLSSTALDFPATGTPKWIELGPSNWLLDWENDSHFLLKTHPPSLTLLGLDVAPDSQFCLELNETNNLYRAVFHLNEPFTALPHLVEIKPGGVVLQYNGGSSFTLTMDGGMRVLDLPPIAGIPDWAIDQPMDVIFTSPDIDLSLATLFARAELPDPAEFFDTGCFALDWGDIRIDNNPTWQLEVNRLDFSLFGQTVSTVSGTAGLDGHLNLIGSLPTNLDVPLLPGSAFSVRPQAGGDPSYRLDFQTAPELRLQLNLPSVSVRSSVAGFSAGGLDVPGISFDTSGTFDTGKNPLPSFQFDGIAISKPSDGALDDNYIRLRRNGAGDIFFDARAQFDPFAGIGLIPDCGLHDFSLTIKNTAIDASLHGNFCVFPGPISLEYNGANNCQFQGGNDDFTIFFGANCAGYRNEWTGLCIGDCTP